MTARKSEKKEDIEAVEWALASLDTVILEVPARIQRDNLRNLSRRLRAAEKRRGK